MTHLSQLLTTIEAAEYLGLKPQTLRKWRGRGDGPRYIRVGPGPRGRVAYRASDLEAWLEERSFDSTAEETVQRAG